MITAVDTNILYDVLLPNAPNANSSERALVEALERGPLVVCEAVCAELAARFSRRGATRTFLRDTGIDFVPSSEASLDLAGEAWRAYTVRRGVAHLCTSCGAANRPVCVRCGTALRARQHVIADFIVGAHATLLSDRLLTRDRGYYGSYFPSLSLV